MELSASFLVLTQKLRSRRALPWAWQARPLTHGLRTRQESVLELVYKDWLPAKKKGHSSLSLSYCMCRKEIDIFLTAGERRP